MNDENNLNKLRSDATWSALSVDQRETIERWLFEDNLSCREIEKRAQSELGLTYSKSAISRLYQHLRFRRAFESLATAQANSTDVNAAAADLAALRSASRKLITARLLEKTMENAGASELHALARLILQSEDREIQRERVALARDRFQFKASQAALKVLPMLDEMTQEQEAMELARIEKIKLAIFGSKPLSEVNDPLSKAPASPNSTS